MHLDGGSDAPRGSNEDAKRELMATVSIGARLCYRFRWLGGVIWQISVDLHVFMVHITRNVMKFVPLSVLAVIFAASLVCAVGITNNVVAQPGDASTVEKSEGQTEIGDGINGRNAGTDIGTNGNNYSSSETELKDPSEDPLETFKVLMTKKIIPILPGLSLLLLCSIFFSTINFLYELPEKQRPIRRAYGYLLVWITVNYFLSLTLLFLIIPEDVKLGTIDKLLFIYCLVATALPEVSSHIRLQMGMGKSSQSLDLHKYKAKVSELITQRLNRATNEERSRALESIAHIYSNRLTDFRERVVLLSLESDLTPEEKSSLTDLLDVQKNTDASVSSMMRDHRVLIPLVLELFRDEIEQFQKSVVANLMHRLGSNVRLDEAYSLVRIGITSRARFMWMSKLRFLRARITSKSGISEVRVQEIYFSTRGKLSLNRRGRVRGAFVIVMLILAVTGIANFHAGRYLEGYLGDPNSPQTADDQKKY